MLGFIHPDDVETERSWLKQGGLNNTGEQGVLHMRLSKESQIPQTSVCCHAHTKRTCLNVSAT